MAWKVAGKSTLYCCKSDAIHRVICDERKRWQQDIAWKLLESDNLEDSFSIIGEAEDFIFKFHDLLNDFKQAECEESDDQLYEKNTENHK